MTTTHDSEQSEAELYRDYEEKSDELWTGC